MLLLAVGLPLGAAEPVSANTPRTTPGGASFIVPAGWSVSTASSSVTLQPPETETHIAILDVQAGDAAAAVASAWSTYRPGVKRPLKLATPDPDRNGWKDGKQFVYETSPNERAVVVAIALRSNGLWTVAILDGSEPTFEKRGAQINTIMQSLRPKDYKRESFAGRKVLPLTPERIEQMKSFVEASMKKLGVPGASMALIDNGNVVYEGGLGVRAMGKPTAVDANTLFMAASNTKGMTTLLLAHLVDEGKLK